MLNINYPKIEKKEFPNLQLNLVEPINKLNLRGKSRDFFTKVGKILSIMLPTESNTSTTIKNISALWLSPDEWMIYGKNVDKNLKLSLDNEISKLNLGSVTDVSDQWVLINMNGENLFEILSKGSPFKSYWDKKTRIGVCADWFIGSKVESAWLSANDLAKKILRF